jgi:hypothetical protein
MRTELRPRSPLGLALGAGIALMLVVAAAAPARGADVALRCQSAIESGGMRFARALLREIDRCSRSYGTSLDACLGSDAARARLDAKLPRWHARVARACASVDAHSVLGYLDTCGPADASCGFATPSVAAPGAENDLVDCLACKLEGRLHGAGRKLFADRPLGGACHASIAEPGLALMRDVLGELKRCLRSPDALSIAGCLSEPERRARIADATLAWRSRAIAACQGTNPFAAVGYPALCSGVTPPEIPFCSDESPPCTFVAASLLDRPTADDDLLDCLECQISEAALGVARDLFGAELCCDDAGCRTVRSRRSCRAAGGHPVFHRVDLLPGAPAGFPHGMAVASDGTVYVPDRIYGGIWTVPPGGTPVIEDLYPLSPDGLTLDAEDRLFITHRESNLIHRFGGDPETERFALNGLPGHEGDGGFATHAKAAAPSGLAFDSRGTLYFTESGLIAFAFQLGAFPTGEFVRSVDPAGKIHTVADPALGISLLLPYSLAVRRDASILVGEAGSQRILELDPGVRIVRIAGKEISPIGAYSGDGGPAIDARFNGVEGLAVDQSGNTLVGDFRNGRIRLVDRLGSIISVLGRDDGVGRFEPFVPPAPGAHLWGGCPGGVAVGPDDRVYVGDGQFEIVRILTKVPY